MSTHRTNLLSAADIEFIEEHGVPYPPRDDLVLVDAQENTVFTVKGLQFYQEAMRVYGGITPLSSLKTVRDHFLFGGHLLQLRREETYQQLARTLAEGAIPVQDRAVCEAMLYGTLDEWKQAVARRQMCVDAGENVIPINFKK